MAMCSLIASRARQAGACSHQILRCLFTRSKGKEVVEEKKLSRRQEKLAIESNTSTNYNMNVLKEKRSLSNKKAYSPPANIREIIKEVGCKYFGEDNWEAASIADPLCKFKVLTELMAITGHDIPNADLSDMKNMQDVTAFFETEVKEASIYEELATGKLTTLPKNLHCQLEALRFDPKTDTMFGGRTAFPGSDTIVKSIKYKRKYDSIKTTKEKPGFTNHYYGY